MRIRKVCFEWQWMKGLLSRLWRRRQTHCYAFQSSGYSRANTGPTHEMLPGVSQSQKEISMLTCRIFRDIEQKNHISKNRLHTSLSSETRVPRQSGSVPKAGARALISARRACSLFVIGRTRKASTIATVRISYAGSSPEYLSVTILSEAVVPKNEAVRTEEPLRFRRKTGSHSIS